MKNLGGRPRHSESEKKQAICIHVRSYHVQLVKDYAKMLNSLPEGEMPTEQCDVVEEPKLMGVIKRDNKDKIIEIIEEPEKKTSEPEVDYTLWQGDALMKELDRAVCYETDGYGYPECAEPIARNNKMLWARAHNAKALGKTDEYNMIMTELWEKVK